VSHPGSQQFQATPRFSTPRARPSSSSFTPGFRHRGTARRDVIDTSSPPSRESTFADENCLRHKEDSVINGDVVQASSPIRNADGSYDSDENHEHHGQVKERRPKRRRLSLSSDIEIQESPSNPVDERESDVEMRDTHLTGPRDLVFDPEGAFTEPVVSPSRRDIGEAIAADRVENSRGGYNLQSGERPPTTQQPKFHKPPRFKPAEVPGAASPAEPLPDAFSPRRKGTKYIPGGLAAELREWLVDVEAGTGSGFGSGSMTSFIGKRGEEWVARIRVDELRGGYGSACGMTLVTGRVVLADTHDTHEEGQIQGENEKGSEVLATNTVRVILAGPGRLSGLGVNYEVKPGSMISMARPTWEFVLDGLGRWGASCDWVVLR
jgi:hypothetical protein